MIACAEFCPTMIGGMPLLIKTCAQEIPFETLEEGDIILHNDPYRGGLHCPEHTFFKPFFVDGELMGFAVCIGHIAEIGGMVPGAFCGEATEIFHEGLRVPPVKIKKARQGRRGGLEAAARQRPHAAPELRRPARDDRLRRSRRRAHQRDRREVRQAVFTRTCEDLMDYAERRMRAELAAFPDGKYGFEDVIENDGIEAKPYTVAIDLYVQGDEVVADYSRSSPQAKGPDQRHARRRDRRGLQRHPARHRPVDPQELGLLPADPGGLAARPRHQRRLSGPAGRRQHRDPSAARQHHHRRHGQPACPSARWPRRAAPAPTSCSAATIPTTTSTSPATTSCRAAGAAASAMTATTA